VVEQAIVDLQIIERSIAAKTLPELKIRLALRCCLKELRTLVIDSPRSKDEQGPDLSEADEPFTMRQLTVVSGL
jgi:hypothetical protein